MRIHKYGTKILRKVARKVRDDFPVSDYSHSMFKTVKKMRGGGLSCPQIGESKRMFVVYTKDLKEVFINPEIEYLGEKVSDSETSLSLPKIKGDIPRYDKIKITYTDVNWDSKERVFEGHLARIIQQSYDHLDGLLFIDYLSDEKMKEIGNSLDKLSMGKEESISPNFGYRPSIRASTSYSDRAWTTSSRPIDMSNVFGESIISDDFDDTGSVDFNDIEDIETDDSTF